MPQSPAPTRLFDRAIVRLTPDSKEEDVKGFLQGLVTNNLNQPLPIYAGLLSAQGKALFDFLVWPSGDREVLIDCEADLAEELIKRLSLYRLRRKIRIAVDPAVAVHWSAGPNVGGVSDPRLGELGQRWLAPIGDAHGGDEKEGADALWRAHRLNSGVPEGRAELGDILWLETNAADLNGVSFSKGCYIGQENTARMNWRQKVNRRLVVVPLDRSEEKRRRAAYPELGFAVDHLRVADIDPAITPPWMSLEPAV